MIAIVQALFLHLPESTRYNVEPLVPGLPHTSLRWTVSDAAYLASPYWPISFLDSDPGWVDAHGVVIPGASHARDIIVSEDSVDNSLTGAGRKLPAFMREHKVASGDSLLFTIEQSSPPVGASTTSPVPSATRPQSTAATKS